ncbi:MAG: hypothetical protein ACREI6_02240, partial [Candidatus Rokuibacteriota bacterium]
MARQLRPGAIQRVPVARADRDPRAGPQELLGGQQAQPPRAAGDQDGPTRQVPVAPAPPQHPAGE